MLKLLKRLRSDERGITTLEYAVLAAIVVGLISTVASPAVSGAITAAFVKITAALA
jgi:Flp pilus assembly pilin Flp